MKKLTQLRARTTKARIDFPRPCKLIVRAELVAGGHRAKGKVTVVLPKKFYRFELKQEVKGFLRSLELGNEVATRLAREHLLARRRTKKRR